ncbi:hypothetical protein [Pusillimonas sp.]|uniref:hypothetical protein n=1 Tax=Pusillimonas sp. TaxID=3040095 RepID=UPI0029BC2FF3|nr:hypothetical protein [Pusillimonas sp.]MDX3895158.1 hypothetical protein [Pusillimonas sp.]
MNEAASIADAHETFVHVRIIIGMILGISVSRLVTGMTRFVQHPGRERAYSVHLAWVVFVLLFIIHFWWFEFSLVKIQTWSFAAYFFLIIYAGTFAVLAAMLFPDHIDEYNGFRGYFQARRKWFYSALLILFVLDVVDTLLKGKAYYHELYDWDYPLRQGLFIAGTAAALFVRSEKYQAALVYLALLVQIVWIVSLFEFLH